MLYDYTEEESEKLQTFQDEQNARSVTLQNELSKLNRDTPEYNSKLEEFTASMDDFIQGYISLTDEFEKAHFDALGGDPETILQNGIEQAPKILEFYYLRNCEFDAEHPETPNNAKLEIGAATEIINRELHLHFDALSSDPARYKALKDNIYKCISISQYVYTDSHKPQITAEQTQNSSTLLNLPTSPASDLLYEILSCGNNQENFMMLKGRNNLLSHTATFSVTENAKKKTRQTTKNNKTESLTFEQSNLDKQLENYKTARKLLVLSLEKINEQALFNGQLQRTYISFPLSELVENGMYSNIRAARKGFNSGMDILTSIKGKGREKKGKKYVSLSVSSPDSDDDFDGLRVLYIGSDIKNSQCYIYLSPYVNWESMALYFSAIPPYYYKLPSRAADLLYYIFYLARQNVKKIENQGYFTISFRSIQERLQLPNEKGAINPGRDIKQPIEDAIERIETEHHNYFHNTEMALLPVYDDKARISDFLNEGYLKVSFSGKFAEKFIAISQNTTKKIDTIKKRRERIIDNAKAASLSKKLDST